MPTQPMVWNEVMAVCDRLEVSPGARDEGYRLQGPSTSPGSRNGTASVTSGTKLATSTSELQMTDRGKTISNFTREFARDSRESNRRGRG